MRKKGFTYLFSTLIIAAYLLSSIGFSVHKCSCEGTTDISILIGNPDCEHLHAHINLSHDSHSHDGECADAEAHDACHHDHHKCQHNHTDGCCTTEVLVLTIDQDNNDSGISVLPAETQNYTFCVSDNGLSILLTQVEAYMALKEAPPIISNSTDLPVISQWRL